MIDSIATSLMGLQTANRQAVSAAENIVNPASYAGDVSDVVDLSAAAGEITSGSLEASVVALKSAAIAYKANAKALEAAFEMQKEAFETLV